MKTLILIFLLLILPVQSLYAATVRVALNRGVAPYIFEGVARGIEYEIINASLKYKGHHLSPAYLPNVRLLEAIKNKDVDAAAPLARRVDIPGLLYSNSHITYQNVAVSSPVTVLTPIIHSIEELDCHKVVAFQSASLFLPEEFEKVVRNHNDYYEMGDQFAQVKSFFGRQDRVIVLEKRIFRYWLHQLPKEDVNIPFRVHDIFPPNNYVVGFWNATLRDDFNEGLHWLRATGAYDAILRKYRGLGAFEGREVPLFPASAEQ